MTISNHVANLHVSHRSGMAATHQKIGSQIFIHVHREENIIQFGERECHRNGIVGLGALQETA